LNHAVSQNEYICTNTTTTGSIASDSERIECPQCQAARQIVEFLFREVASIRQEVAMSRGSLQKQEARASELAQMKRKFLEELKN